MAEKPKDDWLPIADQFLTRFGKKSAKKIARHYHLTNYEESPLGVGSWQCSNMTTPYQSFK